MTMSMMREKQFEACERRLFAHPGVGLFAPEATEADAQALLAGSFDDVGGKSRYTLATLEGLRAAVMERLPREALYISAGEMQLVERLLINDGELLLATGTTWARRKRWSAACGAAFTPKAMTGRCFCPGRCMARWRAPSPRRRRPLRGSACFAMTRPSTAFSTLRGFCTRPSRWVFSCMT